MSSSDKQDMPAGEKNQRVAARILMAVAAIGLVAAFFLPWASADQEFRDAAALMPDLALGEQVDMTVSDATGISLLEYAQVYGAMGSVWQVYVVIMYAVLGVSVVTLLLAALGKPIGASVMAVLAVAGSRVLVWDFGDRGVLPSSTHGWGVAPTVYLVALVVLLAAAVWLFALKRRAKSRARA